MLLIHTWPAVRQVHQVERVGQIELMGRLRILKDRFVIDHPQHPFLVSKNIKCQDDGLSQTAPCRYKSSKYCWWCLGGVENDSNELAPTQPSIETIAPVFRNGVKRHHLEAFGGCFVGSSRCCFRSSSIDNRTSRISHISFLYGIFPPRTIRHCTCGAFPPNNNP
jgi:hypothetical protein